LRLVGSIATLHAAGQLPEALMNRHRFPPMFLAFGLVLLSMSNVAASQEPTASTSPNETSDSAAVPDWMVWRAFQESLRFYARQSSAALNDMLAQRFGLTATERTALLSAGESFLTTIDRIDSEARAELQARYRPRAPRNPARRLPEFPPGVVFRQPGKTVRDLAIESGLYTKVEQKKEALLTAHFQMLERAVTQRKLALMSEWVRTNVRPSIKTAERGISGPPIEHSSANDASPGSNRSDTRER
jgi:hypothetical protein